MSVTFNGQDLSALDGVRITNVTPARPSYTRHKVSIPGRPGSYDFGNAQAEDYAISVGITIVASGRVQLRARINALFAALDGKGALVASGISCQAQVFDNVTFDESMAGTAARGNITFECDST